MVRRPAQLPPRVPLTEDQIGAARYVGSPEHKIGRWWGGLPGAYMPVQGVAQRPGRQLTTVCPLMADAEREIATFWVQQALRTAQMRYYEGDKVYPKRVWYGDQSGQLWTGFCVNGVLGQYKGWPCDEEERGEVFGPLA